jgi:hypothetical protein
MCVCKAKLGEEKDEIFYRSIRKAIYISIESI